MQQGLRLALCGGCGGWVVLACYLCGPPSPTQQGKARQGSRPTPSWRMPYHVPGPPAAHRFAYRFASNIP